MMTGIVATQSRKDIARCIDDWYSGDQTVQNERHQLVIDTIQDNPSYNPQAVILAILQKQCGSFGGG